MEFPHTILHSLVYYSVFSVQCSLFTVHYSLFTVHCSLFTVHCSLFTFHCSLFTVHFSLFTVYCSLFIKFNKYLFPHQNSFSGYLHLLLQQTLATLSQWHDIQLVPQQEWLPKTKEHWYYTHTRPTRKTFQNHKSIHLIANEFNF